MIRITPQVRQNIKNQRKIIKDANSACDQSGSKYEPSRDISSDSVPEYAEDWPKRFRLTDTTSPTTPTAQEPMHVSSGLFEGSVAGSEKYSTSPTASLSGEYVEGGEEEVEGDDKVEKGGETRVGGVDRTRKPEVWKYRFVSEVAFHKFREWWPVRKLIPERLRRQVVALLPAFLCYSSVIFRGSVDRLWVASDIGN